MTEKATNCGRRIYRITLKEKIGSWHHRSGSDLCWTKFAEPTPEPMSIRRRLAIYLDLVVIE